MNIVFVRHGHEADIALGFQQNVVRDGATERADPTAAQVGQCTKMSSVGIAYAEHLAELIIRKRDGEGGAVRGRVLDAAQSDVGIAAGDRLIDGEERDFNELRLAAQATRKKSRHLDVESDNPRWIRRVGFDVRRASLRIAGPSQDAVARSAAARLRGDGTAGGQQDGERCGEATQGGHYKSKINSACAVEVNAK